MADVKREKELAERRKNDPQLDTNQDHLVRKLFSRFRKTGPPTTPTQSNERASTGSSLHTESSVLSHFKDVEKGDGSARSDSENDASQPLTGGNEAASNNNKLAKVFPAPKAGSEEPKPKLKGKWGAFMGGGTGGAGTQSSVESSVEKEESSRESAHPPLSRLGKLKAITAGPATPTPGGNGNKVFPKKGAPVISGGRQETIDELTETPSTGSPSKSPEIRTVKLPAPPVPSVSPSAVSAGLSFPGTMSPEYQQIIASLQDFKVDVKLEIQRLNQKMNKLEDLLGDIATKLNQQLNGPGVTTTSVVPPASTSSTVTFAQSRLLSPTSPSFPVSPFHSHSERDTSPASGEEREGHRRHRGHHHHKHHKHRDRDKDRRRDSKEKTPDTLSPSSSRKSSADIRSPSRSTEREKKKDRKRSKAPVSPTTPTSRPTDSVKKMLEEEIEEQSSSKTSSAGSKEPLIPGKPIYPTAGSRSQEFL